MATDDNNQDPAEGTRSSGQSTSGDSASPGGIDLDELQQANGDNHVHDDVDEQRAAHDLEPVFDVPVKVQAILGRSSLEVSQLLKLAPGAVLELDRKVGEAIDIYVNNRLVARGEVVLVEDHLGVTMTEIIKTERT